MIDFSKHLKSSGGFSKDQVYSVIDYETFSEAPLKDVGSFEYSAHESTDILCVAWRTGTLATIGSAPTKVWAPGFDTADFSDFYQTIMNPKIILVAHNAFFEQVITRNVFATKHMISKRKEILAVTGPERWICTASQAAALALPRSLEGVGKVLNLPIQKDMEGAKLLKKWFKPRKATKHDNRTRHDDPEEFKKIVDYCRTDIAAEVELFLRTPPLTETERAVWVLDQKINMHGIKIDRPLVTTILRMIDEEVEEINRETDELSMGLVASATQVKAVKSFLESDGVFLPDLTKKTVEDAIAEGMVSGSNLRILELRQAISKTSTAKYESFESRTRYDGRLRDSLVYHQASTGRWTAKGVQLQNLPRGTIENTIQAAEILSTGDLELVRMLYADPMSVFSACTRNMIVASPGCVLDVADYSSIELRVLFWVADHEKGLEAIRQGRKQYEEQAAIIFNMDASEIEKDSLERFVGKEATLGCGYQMGAKRFREACQDKGRQISAELAEKAVKGYRRSNAPVVSLWSNIEKAAKAAVVNPGKTFAINHTKWFVEGDYLFCELPSGRRLAYYKASIKYEIPSYGGNEKKSVLYHYSQNATTRQWQNDKTYGGMLTENVVQAIARDLLAEALLRIDAAGWQNVLHVHDEIVSERSVKAQLNHDEFCRLMSVVPKWAKGCPVEAKGFTGTRYKKG